MRAWKRSRRAATDHGVRLLYAPRAASFRAQRAGPYRPPRGSPIAASASRTHQLSLRATGGSVVTADHARAFATDVAIGLSDTPRWLPCRYLYDARGSALFERITEQPEYYLTRTEAGILHRSAGQIADTTGPVTLVELGAGSAIKTNVLLAAYAARYDDSQYVPVDVSEAALREAKRRIEDRHPDVHVHDILGTYEDAFPLFREHSPAMGMFLGSTIGNFSHAESLGFWSRVADHLAPGDFFLLGVDLVKDARILDAAYNDAAGVTAEFTVNLFARMNRELGTEVDLDAVEHVARYNAAWRRIEIFARLRVAQRIRLDLLDLEFELQAGERVMTEISRKFVLDDLRTYVGCFGFEVSEAYTDDQQWFAVLLLRKGEGRD